MSNTAIKLLELDDRELEEFVELWLDRKSEDYHAVERLGASHDKARDVVAFLSPKKHEGPWHLYQCKRKTVGAKLGKSDGLLELGKVFYHHVNGVYKTLPEKYVFVCPRGLTGTLSDLINNPSDLQAALLTDWDTCCAPKITESHAVPLSSIIEAAIRGYPFERVEYLSSNKLVKDSAAGRALTKVLGLSPAEAPKGKVPKKVQKKESRYIEQLRQVYGTVEGSAFASLDQVLAHSTHGPHLRDQRTRFFEAQAFKRFHRDNTFKEALAAFEDDVYHGVVDVFRKKHPDLLERINAVMIHASVLPASIGTRATRPVVRQGICHHLANDGKMKWTL